MEDKRKVVCISDSIDKLTKDNIYEIQDYKYDKDGYLYYITTDDNGVYCIHKATNFINTKQVVIITGDNYSGLLTPYYMVEYFKRKGKDLYVFADDEYCLIGNDKVFSDYNNFNESYYNVDYSYTSIFEDIMSKYDLFDEISREDEVLIQIVKEINNDKYLKIIDIPFNIEYDIREYECSLGEYISEKHRTWS